MTKLVDQDDGRVVEEDNIVQPPRYDGVRPQVVTSDTARQGPLGKPVMWVLAVAVVLAIVGMMAAYLLSGTPAPT